MNFSDYVLRILFFCSSIYCSNKLAGIKNSNSQKTHELSIKLYEIECEALSSSGKYSETFVEQTSEVVNYYLRSNSSALYKTPPLNNCIFLIGLDCLYTALKQEINIEVLRNAILNRLFIKYHNICLNYISSVKDLDPASEEFKELEVISRCVVIMAQECRFYSFEIPNDLVLVLFEFIIRFGIDNIRLEIAFETFYNLLSVEQRQIIFEKILVHFDPERPAIPAVWIQKEDPAFKPIYVDFIHKLYLKVSEISSEINFNRHACMLVHSMFSCIFFQEYEAIILELLNRIEIVRLGIRPAYSNSAIEIISKLSFNWENFVIIEFVCGRLFQNDLIIYKTSLSYLEFSLIFECIYKIHPERYQKHKSSLSAEAKSILNKIEELSAKFDKFETFRDEIFDKIQNNNLAELNDSELLDVEKKFNKLIPECAQYAEHRRLETLVHVKSGSEVLAKIVKESVEYSKSFSVEFLNQVFKIFFKFLQFIFISNFPPKCLPQVFLGVISFYNYNFKNLTLDLSQQEIIKNLINFLINNNLFFKQPKHHATLFEFFSKLNFSSKIGEENMLQFYQNLITKSYSKVYTCYVILCTSSLIGIEINTTFKIFLHQLIIEYLANHSQCPIEFFSEGDIVKFLSLMFSAKIFSKTELELLKLFLKMYALNKNIDFL